MSDRHTIVNTVSHMQITKLLQPKKKTCGKAYLVWRSCKDLKNEGKRRKTWSPYCFFMTPRKTLQVTIKCNFRPPHNMIHTSVKTQKKPKKMVCTLSSNMFTYDSRCLLDVCCQRLLNVCGPPCYKLSPQHIASYNTPFPNPTFVKSMHSTAQLLSLIPPRRGV